MLRKTWERTAKVRYALVAALLGLPLPFVLIAWIFNGCGF